MSGIRLFFEANEPIIQFTYGLAFFAMGLAIALQSRSSSRLELARSLAWLAAFGITHSLFEWGELFSPVHEAYLSATGIERLHQGHLFLLAVSFTCLFEFGVSLLRPVHSKQWLHSLTLATLIGYVGFALILLPAHYDDPHHWHDVADALARYLIGFPGGLLAAYGLREQAFRHIAPLEAPHIVATLRISGIALFLYAIFAGLIPPFIPFFPGNWLNTQTFEAVLGIPVVVFLSFIGLALAISMIRALEIFDVEMEYRLERMELQQIQAAERARLARELHDRTIQTAYSASLIVDSARKLTDPESQMYSRLERAVTALNELIHDLRRNLGELSSTAQIGSLVTALEKIAEDPRYRSLINIHLNASLPEDKQLSSARAEHVLAIIREALSNVIRHANARQVEITARVENGCLMISIEDDGQGLGSLREAGFGVRNMHERARLLGCDLEIANRQPKGTRVLLQIPLSEPSNG